MRDRWGHGRGGDCATAILRGLHLRAVLAVLLGVPTAVVAQTVTVWNGARALELIDRATERRAEPLADSSLHNYEAHAHGMVYFYLDQRDSDERILVKTDQIALEVYWGAPDRTKQRIVGLRNRSTLPNRMYYHLDHLTVVQNDFGDVIRLGDGDEVRDVPHPAAPGADSIYDYRLADSLTIRLPGAAAPVRAYELKVRPKRMDRSAFIGSLYVDRGTADIVRMTFTFTPASYVDKRLDYINISLDNSLWEGRYWLPHEQAVEIRRQVPELDFAVGAVIQGRFLIRDYTFNQDLPPDFFTGYRVVAVPEAEREAYPFEQPLYADLERAGLAPPAPMRDLRIEAARLARQKMLSGLPRVRLNVPNASSALRYDRVEGLALGAGLSYARGESSRLEWTLGYGFGSGHFGGSTAFHTLFGSGVGLRLEAHANARGDLGVRPGMPGALNTVAALAAGKDYTDPYFGSGARLEITRPTGRGWTAGMAATVEAQRSAHRNVAAAPLNGSEAFRPVRAIDPGTLLSGTLSLEHDVALSGTSWGGRLAVEGGALGGRAFARPAASVTLRRALPGRAGVMQIRGATGVLFGDPGVQQLFVLGGRNTLPGYSYRAFAGRAFGLADAEYSRDLFRPWLRGRLLAAAGWTSDLRGATVAGGIDPARDWRVRATNGVRTSIGAGVGLLWDVLRLDVVRGLDGGEWQVLFSVTPDLWQIL